MTTYQITQTTIGSKYHKLTGRSFTAHYEVTTNDLDRVLRDNREAWAGYDNLLTQDDIHFLVEVVEEEQVAS